MGGYRCGRGEPVHAGLLLDRLQQWCGQRIGGQDLFQIGQSEIPLQHGGRFYLVGRVRGGAEIGHLHRASVELFHFALECVDLVGDGFVAAVAQRELFDGLFDVAQDRGGVTDDVGEVAVVFGDAFVDALLDGVGVEIVGDLDVLVAGSDPVDATDALFDAHEVPRHVVVDQPTAGLQVQALAHRIGADEHGQVPVAEPFLDLGFADLLPADGGGVVDLTAAPGVAADPGDAGGD